MTNREIVAWVLVGFIIGFLCALWLSQHGTRPEPEPPCADARPKPQPVDDLHNADFREDVPA